MRSAGLSHSWLGQAAAFAVVTVVLGAALTVPPSAVRATSGTPDVLPAPITVPAARVRSMPFDDLTIDAVVGASVYHVPIGSPARLFVANVALRTDRHIRLNLRPDEQIASVETDGGALVILAWRRLNPGGGGGVPCRGDESHPLAWRILVAPLRAGLPAGTFRQLDSGLSRLVFTPAKAGEYCPGPLIPKLATVHGDVAYAIEHATSDRPAGSRIIVRSLGSGAPVRTIDTQSQVFALAFSDSTVAWTESENATATSTRDVPWHVMRATLPTGRPSEVNVGPHRRWLVVPYTIGLDGSVLLIQAPGRQGVGNVERLIPGSQAQVLNPPGVPFCNLLGADAGVVALSCERPGGLPVFALWRKGSGTHPVADVAEPIIGGGSLAWLTETRAAAGWHERLNEVPLSALRWP